MRIKIAKQKNSLKEQQAHRPDRRDSSKPGKNYLSNQRFDLKKQKRTQKNRQRVQQIGWRIPHVSPEPRRRDGEIIRGDGLHSSFSFSCVWIVSERGYSYRNATMGSTRVARLAGM